MGDWDPDAASARELRSAQRLAYRTRNPLWWCNLAAFYATGHGTRVDLVRARSWYRRAAKAGYAGGMYELGLMYVMGEGGPRRPAIGRQLLLRAAAAGDVDALKIVEHGYQHGAWGFERSRAKARVMTRRLRAAGTLACSSDVR